MTGLKLGNTYNAESISTISATGQNVVISNLQASNVRLSPSIQVTESSSITTTASAMTLVDGSSGSNIEITLPSTSAVGQIRVVLLTAGPGTVTISDTGLQLVNPGDSASFIYSGAANGWIILAQGPNVAFTNLVVEAADTRVIGGSWLVRMLPYLSPAPAIQDSAVNGQGIQDFAFLLGRSGSIFENRGSNSIVWPLTANDVNAAVNPVQIDYFIGGGYQARGANAGTTTFVALTTYYELDYNLTSIGAENGVDLINVSGDNKIQFLKAGTYTVLVSVQGAYLDNSPSKDSTKVVTMGVGIGLNAVVPTLPIFQISGDFSIVPPPVDPMTDDHFVQMMNSGSNFITVAANDILNVYAASLINGTAGDVFNLNQLGVTVVLHSEPDVFVSNIDSQVSNLIYQAIGVIAWNNSTGTFYPAIGGSAAGSYPEAKTKVNSSGQGDPGNPIITVTDTPGYFLIYLLLGGARLFTGIVTEGANVIDFESNTAAYTSRDASLDVIPFIYKSTTGQFTAEFWSLGLNTSQAGFVFGALKLDGQKPIILFTEMTRWDASGNNSLDVLDRTSNTMEMVIRGIVRLWRAMGGQGTYRVLPIMQYFMTDEVHLPQTNQTQLLNAQWVNEVLR